MQKIKTTVRIAGREYTIAGYDSEEYVQNVASWVDKRMSDLSLATHLPPAQLAVLTALNAADDMMKSREEVRHLKMQIEQMKETMEKMTNDSKA